MNGNPGSVSIAAPRQVSRKVTDEAAAIHGSRSRPARAMMRPERAGRRPSGSARKTEAPERHGETRHGCEGTFLADGADFDGPVLVTGAGGCIGSRVIAILTRAGVPRGSAFDLREDRRRPALAQRRRGARRFFLKSGLVPDFFFLPSRVIRGRARPRRAIAIVHLVRPAGAVLQGRSGRGGAGERRRQRRERPRGCARAWHPPRDLRELDRGAQRRRSPAGSDPLRRHKSQLQRADLVITRTGALLAQGLRPGVVYGVGRDRGTPSRRRRRRARSRSGEPYTVPFRGETSRPGRGRGRELFVRAVLERDARVFDCNGACDGGELEHPELARARRPDRRVGRSAAVSRGSRPTSRFVPTSATTGRSRSRTAYAKVPRGRGAGRRSVARGVLRRKYGPKPAYRVAERHVGSPRGLSTDPSYPTGRHPLPWLAALQPSAVLAPIADLVRNLGKRHVRAPRSPCSFWSSSSTTTPRSPRRRPS